MELVSRRTRRPDSLAAAVVEVLAAFQCPISTDAMRVVLSDGGRRVTAEHLGRLAAYERQDRLRTLMPPRLCSVIGVDAHAVRPRWWALGDWRLQRRIMTEDVRPIWFATLAVGLCSRLADRTDEPGTAIITLAVGSASRALDGRHIDVPMSGDEWQALYELVYAPYNGALNNLGGATKQQADAETRLTAAGIPGVDLYFGR